MIMSKPIQLSGKMLAFSRIKILSDSMSDIQTALGELVNSNKATTGIPVVIDSKSMLALDTLIDFMWSIGIQPIGVIDGILNAQAKQLRLAIFPADGKRIERLAPKTDSIEQPIQQAQQTDTSPITSSIHTQMVRSGQSIHHFGGDLTIVGGVNHGAEVITDNSLHIYSHGLGRLVAGATGDKHARIFCQKFNPTLVSVAGTYCLREDIPSQMIDQAVQVSYDEVKGLVFSLINS